MTGFFPSCFQRVFGGLYGSLLRTLGRRRLGTTRPRGSNIWAMKVIKLLPVESAVALKHFETLGSQGEIKVILLDY